MPAPGDYNTEYPMLLETKNKIKLLEPFKGSKIHHRLQMYDPTLTEYQHMENHGFWRVWDCGTLKFTMFNQDQ